MIKLGLTGGIGSGKSTVAKVFQELGVPVYFADIEAKKFLDEKTVIQKLVQYFGDGILEKARINKAALAAIVFTDEVALAKLNALIHPLLEADFRAWLNQNSEVKYIVKEAAILFEAGFDKSVDKVLTISAPIEQRITRVMNRDGVSRKQVMDRVTKQWSDEQREAKSDYVIVNADSNMILEKILEIHKELSL